MTASTRRVMMTMAAIMPGEVGGLLEASCSEDAWVGRALLLVSPEGGAPGNVGSTAPRPSSSPLALLLELLLEGEGGEGGNGGDGPGGDWFEGTVALAASAVVVVSDVAVVVVAVAVVLDAVVVVLVTLVPVIEVAVPVKVVSVALVVVVVEVAVVVVVVVLNFAPGAGQHLKSFVN